MRLLTLLPDVLERSTAQDAFGDGDEPIRTSRDYRAGSFAELEWALAQLRDLKPRWWRHLQRRYLTAQVSRRKLFYRERKVHGQTVRQPLGLERRKTLGLEELILNGRAELMSVTVEKQQKPDGTAEFVMFGTVREWQNPVDPQIVQLGLAFLTENWPQTCVSCGGAGRTTHGTCRTCGGSGGARVPMLPEDARVAA